MESDILSVREEINAWEGIMGNLLESECVEFIHIAIVHRHHKSSLC